MSAGLPLMVIAPVDAFVVSARMRSSPAVCAIAKNWAAVVERGNLAGEVTLASSVEIVLTLGAPSDPFALMGKIVDWVGAKASTHLWPTKAVRYLNARALEGSERRAGSIDHVVAA